MNQQLITEHSMNPFEIESMRRERLTNDIHRLVEQISRLLILFRRNSLYFPHDLSHCAYKWESELADQIWNAYYTLEEQVQSALSDFEKATVQPSWFLWDCFGCNDIEYAVSVKSFYEKIRLFEIDVNILIKPQYNFLDDLPF